MLIIKIMTSHFAGEKKAKYYKAAKVSNKKNLFGLMKLIIIRLHKVQRLY